MIEDIDYLISAVSYNQSDGKIKKVLTHEKKDQYGVGYPFEETREQVLKKMEKGKSYYTLIKGQNTPFEYDVGDKIEKVEIESEIYLRTDERQKKKDFLGGTQSIEEFYQ